MSDLIPKGLPDYKELLAEGREVAKTIDIGVSKFEEVNGMPLSKWAMKKRDEGVVTFLGQLGSPTVDDQVEAQKLLYERVKEAGVEMGNNLLTSDWLNGLPHEMRDKAPKGASTVLSGAEDYIRIANASPIQPNYADNTCHTPNAISNVTNAIKAGCLQIGTFSQIAWKYPYWKDDVKECADTIKAMGILSGIKDRHEDAVITSYVGDGLASAFLDHASEIGYILFEQYIAEQLCDVRYISSLGGLMSYVPTKLATWLAMTDVLKENSIIPERCLLYMFEGNTIEPSAEHPMSNFGLVLNDFIPFAILERKYHTGTPYNAKPIMEAIRVPTPSEIADVVQACNGALQKLHEWEEGEMFSDSVILEKKAELIEGGREFYHNIKKHLPDVGVDITDPLQCILAIRKMPGSELEALCHQKKRNKSKFRGIDPVAITDLAMQVMDDVVVTVEELKNNGIGDSAKGKKVITCSTDTHEYGVMFITELLRNFGAEVVNIGVDVDPEDALDKAFKEKAPYLAVSTHNGQCLSWSESLTNEIKKRNQDIKVIIGGTLNKMPEGEENANPIDVSKDIESLGIVNGNDFKVIFDTLANN